MKNSHFKILSLAGLFAVSLGLINGITNKQEAAHADANCLGTINISTAKLAAPYGDENPNCFLGLWLTGTDYPDVDGSSAVQNNDVFTYIGAADNYSHIKLNGVTCEQTHNDIYVNFWTYHPVFAFCLFNSREITNTTTAGTIEIDKSFRIPSYDAIRGIAPTYYVLEKDVTISRPSDSFSVPSPGWSPALKITAAASKVGEAQIEENFAYFDLDPTNDTSFVSVFRVSGVDYASKASPNQPFAGPAKNDYETKIRINGKKVSEYTHTDALISKWTSPVDNFFGFSFTVPSGFTKADILDVDVAKGMLIPAANGSDYYEIDAHYVALIDVRGFTNCNQLDSFITQYLNNDSAEFETLKDAFNLLPLAERHIFFTATNVYGSEATKLTNLAATNNVTIQDYSLDGNKELGEISIQSLRSYNPFGNNNEFLWIKLNPSEVDYPDEDGEAAGQIQLNESKINYLKNALKGIELYDSNDNKIDYDVFDGYANMFSYHPVFTVGLTNLAQATRIVLPKGLPIPSYSFIKEEKTDTYGHYVLDKTYELSLVNGATHNQGDFNDWSLPVVTITYLNDIGNSMASYPDEVVECGQNYTLKGAPEKEGYSSYWTVVEPTGLEINGLHIVAPESPCTIVLKATYIGREYNLSFEGVNTIPYKVTFGEQIGNDLPAIPNKEGYSNGRWVIDGTTITKDYVWNFASNKTAVAEYDLNSYTVTFDTNGGSEIASLTVNHGETVARPENPTKEGYAFDNWYSDSNFTQVYDFDSIITTNITLYAKWNQCYTVTFDTDGGSLIESVVVLAGEKVTKPQFNPTKEGYEFVGWYVGEQEFDFETPITANITIKAHYKKLEEEKKGCSGSFEMASILVAGVSVLGLSLLLLKKKETN